MRVPKPGMLCGWCGKPVIQHAQAIEEFVPDPRPGAPPGLVRKQLYHKRRCWSKHVRDRLRAARREVEADPLMAAALELVKLKGQEHGLSPDEIESRLEDVTRGALVRQPGLVADVVDPREGLFGEVEMASQVGKGKLTKAIEDYILEMGEKWWSRADLVAAITQQLPTTEGSVKQSLNILHKRLKLEQRHKGNNFLEYRLGGSTAPAPIIPPMLDKPYEEKVGRQVEERHSTRPTHWEKEQARLVEQSGREVFEQAQREAATDSVAPVEEPVMAQNGHSNGVGRQLFILKSERMLSELERTLQSLIADAIKSAREQIARMAEEELR